MKIKLKCYFCNKTIYKIKCRLKNHNRHFCNNICLNNYFASCYKKLKCSNCGKIFSTFNSYSNGKMHFCNKKCQKKFNGHKHWNYIDGTSSIYPIEFSKSLREFIRKRDGYKCMNCGVPQLELERALDVHHIDYDKNNNDPINLLSLCGICNPIANKNRKYWQEFYENLQIERKVHLLERTI